MIRTVTVYTGDSDCANAAQQHAIALAKRVSARLKIVGIRDAGKDALEKSGLESAANLVQRKREALAETAERAGVRVVTGFRGNGMKRGLLEEARETDVLVLGLPTGAEMESDDAAAHLVRKERAILRKATCALLLVNQPPSSIKKILACYTEDPVGQRMLQMAGLIAEEYQARVGVLTTETDPAKNTELAAAANEYLKAFDIPSTETLTGLTDSKVDRLEAADSFGADLIAMGEEGHNWLERLMSANVAERTAVSTSIPVLIVR